MTPAVRTPLSLAEASVACLQAHEKVFGKPPGERLLCMLVAQSALETGRWKSMWCWNAGNLRGHGNAGTTSIEGASEVVDGHEYWFRHGAWMDRAGSPAPADVAARLGDNGFAAYQSPVDGFEAFVRFLGTASHPPSPNRYQAAWEAAERGDVGGYCQGLRKNSYFTADLGLYTKGVKDQFDWVQSGLFGESDGIR
jgi:hypothetical protein